MSVTSDNRPKRSTIQCGQSKYKPFQSLVAGGQKFEAGTWPWLGALYVHLRFMCGSTIITPTVAITAAHCFQDKKEETKKNAQHCFLIAGKHALESTSDADYTIATINKILIHPYWKPNLQSYDADIAAMILTHPLQYTKAIQPLCLPDSRENHDDLIGVYGTVAGWGLNEQEQTTENDPRIIDIPVVRDDVCIDSEIGFGTIMTHKTFCSDKKLKKAPCKVMFQNM